MKAESHERLEEEVSRLTEDFLASLARAISDQEKHEYSVEEMESRVRGLEAVLAVLSQRWSLAIIFLLYMRSLKFNEFKELLQGISSRTLTDKLRMLEREGLVARSVASNPPVRVSYSLTTRGREIALSCLPLLYQLRKQR